MMINTTIKNLKNLGVMIPMISTFNVPTWLLGKNNFLIDPD